MDNKINEWLQTYEPINEIAIIEEIHNEELSDSMKNLALQRVGFQTLQMKYVTDRGWLRRYEYMLLLKSESEIDEQRLTNLSWLDDLSDWLVVQKQLNNLPILEDNKKVINVSCANSLTYDESEDGSISTYALQIYFDIRKEK